MIYDIIGHKQDTIALAKKLSSTYGFCVVELDEVLSKLPRKYQYLIITDINIRSQFLSALQGCFKHIVIVSNIICSCKPEELKNIPMYIISTDVDDERIQRLKPIMGSYLYQSEEIEPILKSIDTTEQSVGERRFKELISNMEEYYKMGKSLEECIREQLESLGVKSTETPAPVPKKVVEKPEIKEQEEPIKKAVAPPKKQVVRTSIVNKPKDVPETKEQEEIASSSLFCKVTDNKMAIMIPSNFPIEKRILGGQEYLVATVSLPDLNNTSLQELMVAQEKKQPEVVTKPKSESEVKPKESITKPKIDIPSGDLDVLVQEKADLDLKIKDARNKGDETLVLELRKQRRVLRKQINKLKG